MIKSIVSTVIVAVILICASLFECFFVQKQFKELAVVTQTVYEKTEEKICTEDDVYALQKNWLDRKKYLHAFIPHNEIKEIDLWLSESVILVRDKEWTDALSKLEVLKELIEQIPNAFKITFENIF